MAQEVGLRGVDRLSKADPIVRKQWERLTRTHQWIGGDPSAIQLVNGVLQIVTADGQPVQVIDGELQLVLDGTSLSQTGAGLRVNPDFFVFNEVPAGTVNGINDTFTLAFPPLPDTLQLFNNGVLLTRGVGFDYTLTGVQEITFAAGAIPITDSNLLAHYWKDES